MGRFLLRLVLGSLFVGHGTQKLFGWFGGGGLEGTGKFFEQVGLRPGRRNALAAGLAETGGGLAIGTGFATPLAASALIGTMLTAIRRVHFPKGPWVSDGGYEYNLVMIGAAATLAEEGAGAASLDRRLGIERKGAVWGLAALAAGAGGALAVELAARRSSDLGADGEAAPGDSEG